MKRQFRSKKQFNRINYQIRAAKVRLIGSDGKQIGIVSLKEALNKADEEGMDLIEISPQADPPVCKILSYDKFKYEQQKKNREARKKQKEVEVKEFRLRPNIFKNDFEQRLERMREFIQKGHRIKVTIQFQGREMAHKDLGYQKINEVLENLGDTVVIDQEPMFRGRRLIILLNPNLKTKKN